MMGRWRGRPHLFITPAVQLRDKVPGGLLFFPAAGPARVKNGSRRCLSIGRGCASFHRRRHKRHRRNNGQGTIPAVIGPVARGGRRKNARPLRSTLHKTRASRSRFRMRSPLFAPSISEDDGAAAAGKQDDDKS